MSDQLLLTNNPLVVQEEGGPTVRQVEGLGLNAVFEAALELVLSGYKLVSAPLPPNVPLIRAPYRSLILEKNSRQYDAEGIRMLTKAGERARTLERPIFNEKNAQDAAFIDREILHRALSECRGQA